MTVDRMTPAMSLLLDAPEIRERLYPLSIEAYHVFCELGQVSEKVELLRGIVVNKMAKSPLHSLIVQRLSDKLRTQVDDAVAVRVEQPLTLLDSEPEPDVSLVWNPLEAGRHPHFAALICEVALTSVVIDRKKAEIYAEAGIPEYWLVRPEQREVDVYRAPSAEGYAEQRTLRDGDTLECLALPGVVIAVSEIFPPRGS